MGTADCSAGEELQLVKAIVLRHHDFAASGYAGQQRQVQIAAGLAQFAGGKSKPTAKKRAMDSMNSADDGLRQGLGNG